MSNETSIVNVALGGRSYDILIGGDLLARAGDIIKPLLASPRAIIITDEAVGALYGGALEASLKAANITATTITVPQGESSKSFAQYSALMEQLLALKPDRKTALIALGGGVIGDLTGFAASTLLRGVPFVQIPTSLLAQVDSSVGGKTAINAKAGKNLIGSFYQPLLVLADTDVLKTLPPREMRAGYAEIIKYGLIADGEFYQWCLAHGGDVLKGDASALAHAIQHSCARKAAIVSADEREADTRALLNFGHTFAHALEAETGFSDVLLHGEAVAIGMVMATRLSARMGLIDAALEKELSKHFTSLGMAANLNDVKTTWSAKDIARHFSSDKKAERGTLTFVVLTCVGQATIIKNTDPALARSVVDSYLV
jgi:3-dehydroquinate synthase